MSKNRMMDLNQQCNGKPVGKSKNLVLQLKCQETPFGIRLGYPNGETSRYFDGQQPGLPEYIFHSDQFTLSVVPISGGFELVLEIQDAAADAMAALPLDEAA
jgi:hypothetical protein